MKMACFLYLFPPKLHSLKRAMFNGGWTILQPSQTQFSFLGCETFWRFCDEYLTIMNY